MESYCNNMNSCNTRPMRSGRNISSNCNYGRRTIQDSNHRHMEVECVCRMTPGKNCHKEDPMMQLGNAFSAGYGICSMATVGRNVRYRMCIETGNDIQGFKLCILWGEVLIWKICVRKICLNLSKTRILP